MIKTFLCETENERQILLKSSLQFCYSWATCKIFMKKKKLKRYPVSENCYIFELIKNKRLFTADGHWNQIRPKKEKEGTSIDISYKSIPVSCATKTIWFRREHILSTRSLGTRPLSILGRSSDWTGIRNWGTKIVTWGMFFFFFLPIEYIEDVHPIVLEG